MSKVKNWSWSWGLTPVQETYVYVRHSSFILFVASLVAIVNPEGFGHWIGRIIHAVKEAI